jgi:hypothetical protein
MNIDTYVRGVVRSQPDPPRIASLRALVAKSYLNRVALMLLAFGLALGIAGAAVALIAQGPAWLRAVMFLVSGAVAILFAGSPAIRAVRYYRALRNGIRVVAEVTEAAWTSPSIRPPTIEAGSHGMTRGIRRVHHPSMTFEQAFESDAPWAARLGPGSSVWLLADRTRPRVLIDLGPVDGLTRD